LRIGYSPLLRQSLLASNKPLKEAKGRFKISIDALHNQIKITTPSRKFIVGNFVRISKAKYIFNKGYTPNWTTELLKLLKVDGYLNFHPNNSLLQNVLEFRCYYKHTKK
jgi:hypothetical protein